MHSMYAFYACILCMYSMHVFYTCTLAKHCLFFGDRDHFGQNIAYSLEIDIILVKTLLILGRSTLAPRFLKSEGDLRQNIVFCVFLMLD